MEWTPNQRPPARAPRGAGAPSMVSEVSESHNPHLRIFASVEAFVALGVAAGRVSTLWCRHGQIEIVVFTSQYSICHKIDRGITQSRKKKTLTMYVVIARLMCGLAKVRRRQARADKASRARAARVPQVQGP